MVFGIVVVSDQPSGSHLASSATISRRGFEMTPRQRFRICSAGFHQTVPGGPVQTDLIFHSNNPY
jgi:hypothetical protein